MIIDKFEFPSGDAQSHCSSIIQQIMDANPVNYKMVSKDHIWDEDKSVKWNREETERYNDEICEKRAAAFADRALSFEKLDEALIDWIVEDVNYLINEKFHVSKDSVRRFYNAFRYEVGTPEIYTNIRFISKLISAYNGNE